MTINITRRDFLKFGTFTTIAAALGSYTFFIERNIVLINRYKIVVKNLPPLFEGFTIAHLTDLHYGLFVSLKHIKDIIEKTNSLRADLIVCTGDYVHERISTQQIDMVWTELSKLHAPCGVLSTLGNHDHWADTDRSVYWLDKSGQNLRHKIKQIKRGNESLWFAGAGDLWEDNINIDSLLNNIPPQQCSIVLAHNPDSADRISETRTDLVISGHTHGGQVSFPLIGPPILPVQNKNYTSGLTLSKSGIQVFISRGIGWAIYPVRFNCYPEIAVLELTAQPFHNQAL